MIVCILALSHIKKDKNMLKEIIIFTGGLVAGALGSAYYAGYKAGKSEEYSEDKIVEKQENQDETFYEENSDNFQTI